MPSELFDSHERKDAQLGVLESDGLASVPIVTQPVQTEQVPGHVVAGNLLATVVGEDRSLERAQLDRIQRRENCTVMEEGVALLELGPVAEQRFEFVEIGIRQSHRQAQCAHAARAAVGAQAVDRHDLADAGKVFRARDWA